MKTCTRLLTVLLAFAWSHNLSGQCAPDTANCKDEGNPGEFCPKSLPDAVVGVEYDEVITVIAPGQAVVNGTTISITYIEVDSVTNLPPGMAYYPNAEQFYPDSAYCIQITGTPETAGDYQLGIYVSPFVTVSGVLTKGPQVVDDTSVVVTVSASAGIDPARSSEFQVLQNIPNPFREVTRMGIYTPDDKRVDLEIYSILGELMHQEQMGVPPGTHYFGFNGRDLLPGTYIYKVSTAEEIHTGKIVKAR